MIHYKLHLRPPGFEASSATVVVEGRASSGASLSTIANNVGIVFDWVQTTSRDADCGVEHAEKHADEPKEPTL